MQKQKTEHNYIYILKDSLKEKIKCLESLINNNTMFERLLSGQEMDNEAFDENMAEKNILIKKLEQLDDGFVGIYNRVKEVLVNDKDTYRTDIAQMQELLKKITDLTVKLEILEKSNKELFANRVSSMTGQIKVARTSNKVAVNYYQNMAKLNVIEPQFMDKKK